MDEMFIWKVESFIFDLFAYATSINTLVYPRSRCYAPLKNASGDASVQTVRAALQESDRHTYFHLTGKEPPSRPFELDQAFYYPTDTLRTHWQGKPLPPSDYIDT
jgi:UDP-N-acetylglucosamine/UDP-N-acetylgalactosamine diphosphorylase